MFTFCRSQIMIRCTSKIKWLKVAFSKLFILPPSSDFWGIIFHGWRNMPANLTVGGANNNGLSSAVFYYRESKDFEYLNSKYNNRLNIALLIGAALSILCKFYFHRCYWSLYCLLWWTMTSCYVQPVVMVTIPMHCVQEEMKFTTLTTCFNISFSLKAKAKSTLCLSVTMVQTTPRGERW